jgi:hypothetical protein
MVVWRLVSELQTITDANPTPKKRREWAHLIMGCVICLAGTALADNEGGRK